MNIVSTGMRQLSPAERAGLVSTTRVSVVSRPVPALCQPAPAGTVAWTGGKFFVPGAVGIVRL